MLDFWGSKATQLTQLLLTNIELELNYHRSRSFQRDGTYLCPVSVDWQVPVDASHTLMVQSLLALAILPPQGEKDTDITQPLLKNTKLVLNTKLQEKAFYARKWDVPVPPQG